MARPRKYPDDPKWQKQEVNDYYILLFAAALGGLVAKGGLQHDQMIKMASEIAREAQKSLS